MQQTAAGQTIPVYTGRAINGWSDELIRARSSDTDGILLSKQNTNEKLVIKTTPK